QTTLTALLTGKLAFKVFNTKTSKWEELRILVPDLETHTGAIATATELGHVKLVTDFESHSEDTAPTAKALSITFEAISAHVNEEESHLTAGQNILINQIPSLIDRIAALEKQLNPTEP